MSDNTFKTYSMNEKRLVLIVEDEKTNQELFGVILKNSFDLIYASNGKEALKKVRENRHSLSLVILDLYLPDTDGRNVLKTLMKDRELKNIPVIVCTGDHEAEVECLKLGAADFITKPYPKPEIIEARALKAIEYNENREIIHLTERDHLTGLYNRDYFYRYVEQYDLHNPDIEMDALVLDINRFRLINERYGRENSDKLLYEVARSLLKHYGKNGMVSRRLADTYMVYTPHLKNYKRVISDIKEDLKKTDLDNINVHFRLGVYAYVDKKVDAEKRFSRAKQAADTIRDDYNNYVAFYTEEQQNIELYKEQLIEDLENALKLHQLEIYYQPKFKVFHDKYILHSAEALVRWQHPQLGFISPNDFIPLFETNGLIRQLDRYVWRKAAEQIKAWKKKYGLSVPVSVNVSRIDVLDPHFIKEIQDLMKKYGLNTDEFILEITESAYIDDAEEIITNVKKLRDLGFKIEMDDFGAGYSSLGMLSKMPIVSMKLDKMFVDNYTGREKDGRMLMLIMDIADYLGVEVVVEGVETKPQLDALVAIGCDIFQGYFFSKPVTADGFGRFIEERIRLQEEEISLLEGRNVDFDYVSDLHTKNVHMEISRALSLFYNQIYYVDLNNNDRFIKFSSQEKYYRLRAEETGDKFFVFCRKLIRKYVDERDRERALEFCNRKEILKLVSEGKQDRITVRTNFDGIITQIGIRIIGITDEDDKHLIVAISDINEKIINAITSNKKG
ncbi:MAG: EAL domain-containing protein [Erysipelotrichaceae bacterium]|nr:EAL domain-containing protein [Erysipelotrichaceae bacterium]